MSHALPQTAHRSTVLARVRKELMDQPMFRNTSVHLARMVSCSPKEKCARFVDDALFCLSFADQLAGQMKDLEGAAEERRFCSHVKPAFESLERRAILEMHLRSQGPSAHLKALAKTKL